MRVASSRTIANSFRPAFLVVALLAGLIPIRAERLPIKIYTTADGLAHNRVNKIVRDSHGFLWFCTADGLSRFDGYSFTNYSTDQGLPHRTVTDFLETRKGEYWIATAAGLVRFNPNAAPEHRVIYATQTASHLRPMFTVVVGDKDQPAAMVTVLFEDHDGVIWCGTAKGLFRLEEEREQFALQPINIGIPPEWGEGGIINDLLEGGDGSLWIATPGGLYRRWPDGSSARYTKRDGLPDDYLHDLLVDNRGQLWAGTRYGGFFQFAVDNTQRPPVVVASYSMREGMPTTWVFQLFEASDHKFWIATSHGLLEFFPNRDERGRWFHAYSEKNGLSYFDVTALNSDLGGNLWLGTNNAGAMELERDGFVTYDQRDGLREVSSMFEDRAGAVCFRGAVFGDEHKSVFEGARPDPLGGPLDYHHLRLGRFDGQRFNWFKPDNVPDLGWRSEGVTLQARNGEWWIGTTVGLYRFPVTDNFDQIKTARPLAVYKAKDGIEDNQLLRLFADSRGNVWVARWFGPKPLWLWERATQTLRDLSSAPGFDIQSDLPHSFCEDRAGNVWIGFVDRIARYRDGRFTFFTATDGVPAGALTSLYLDHAGRLWFASTRSGLVRVDDPEGERPRFFNYTTEQGLSSNSTEVYADRLIVEDLQGRIYVGTARGLDRLDPTTGRFWHFTTADGLASGSFRSCFRDRNGGLWFGMTGGLSHLIPSASQPTQAPPPILISGLLVAGARQFVSALGESGIALADLAPGQNQLQIDFLGLSFDPGEVLQYQYKLQGTDSDWSAPTEQRTVAYRLTPGRYTFLVRAVNSAGIVSAEPAVITFRILPPVWLRWWFITLIGIGLTLALYRFYLYRVGRLLELERVRTRIATDLHDDIGSSLSRMAILSEVAKRQIDGTEEGSASILTEIAESARGVVDSMNDIVWAIDPRRDDLRNVVFRVRQFASDLLGSKGIAWSLQAPAEFDKIKLNPQQRRHIFLIFKEAINNAARHAECKSVWLSLSIVHNQIVGEIRDDGHGMSVNSDQVASDRDGVHGLVNMRTRAAQLNGQLIVASPSDGGTSIRIEVPLKQGIHTQPWHKYAMVRSKQIR